MAYIHHPQITSRPHPNSYLYDPHFVSDRSQYPIHPYSTRLTDVRETTDDYRFTRQPFYHPQRTDDRMRRRGDAPTLLYDSRAEYISRRPVERPTPVTSTHLYRPTPRRLVQSEYLEEQLAYTPILEYTPRVQPTYTQQQSRSHVKLDARHVRKTSGPVVNFDLPSDHRKVLEKSWARTTIITEQHSVVKTVQPDQGNLVLEVPVPSQVIPPIKGFEKSPPYEASYLRYSAITCDPDLFWSNGFTLRQQLMGRKTEIFIVMTMYNEDESLFLKTMNAVIQNIKFLCSRTKSRTWGPDAWQKIVVCIVQDGRKSMNPRTLKAIQLMGAYAEGVMKDTVAGKSVQAHVFEYTSHVELTQKGEAGLGSVPIQILFCLKENNAKKLNSHRWFFNAFAPCLDPKICVLLDVGTRPTTKSIRALYKAFERNPNCGGACGEICADLGRFNSKLFNPIVASQNFEYKMSNILDKPFESVAGYISVLPGAFSAYRYEALLNHEDGTGPLASYFKGEKMYDLTAAASLSNRNMFLAEDRILAFEIITKKRARWTLHYVRSACAYTDVPESVDGLIFQRRRWLNGAMFANLYSVLHFFRIWSSGQLLPRKISLTLLTFYNFIGILFTFFSISSFYLAFYFIGMASISNGLDAFGGFGTEIMSVFNKLYVAIMFVVVVCSLGNRPSGSRWYYMSCVIIFALCQGLLLYCVGYHIYKTVPRTSAEWSSISSLWNDKPFRDLSLSFIATYGIYLVSSLLYLTPWHMITSFLQYLLLLPTYTNVIMVYALCNLQDVTWGNRPEAAPKDLGSALLIQKDGLSVLEVELKTAPEDLEILYEQARMELQQSAPKYKEKRSPDLKRLDCDRNFRTNVVLAFLGCNITVILLFTSDAFNQWLARQFNLDTTGNFNPYMIFIFWSVLCLAGIRFIGSLLYLVLNLFNL